MNSGERDLPSPSPTMETINPLLANAMDLLKHGKIELAEPEFARAATACVAEFGEKDIVTARTLSHLARVCSSLGKIDLAVPMYERILRIHEALPVPANSDHAVALLELAELREDGGRQQDVGILRRRADAIITQVGARMEDMAAEKESADTGSSSEDDESSGSDGDSGGDSGEENSGGSDGGGGNSDAEADRKKRVNGSGNPTRVS